MKIMKEIDSIEYFKAWSGGADTLNKVIEAGSHYVDALDDLIYEYFGDDPIDETILNDFLWFDDDTIFDAIGLTEKEDDEEEKEETMKMVEITEDRIVFDNGQTITYTNLRNGARPNFLEAKMDKDEEFSNPLCFEECPDGGFWFGEGDHGMTYISYKNPNGSRSKDFIDIKYNGESVFHF